MPEGLTREEREWVAREEAALESELLQTRVEGERQRLNTQLTTSQFAEMFLCYDEDKPVSFARRPWLRRIMDSEYTPSRRREDGRWMMPRWTLLKCARQVEKSSGLSFKGLAWTQLIDNLCFLYVSSAGANTKEFADERLANTLRISPLLSEFAGKLIKDDAALKRFSNNSRIVLRSAYRENVGRVRGIPADVVAIDEIQDFLSDVVPIITAAAKNSDLPYGHVRLFSGTPLTSDNYLSQVWRKESTQNLWLTRCPGCRHWNPPGLEQVGRKGMICCRCGKALNPLLGRWVRTGPADAAYEGYHLSQVMMPYTRIDNIDRFEEKWQELYRDIHSPTAIEAKVRNEILGEEWDVGRKPITEQQCLACCQDWNTLARLAPARVRQHSDWSVFMGVDWGSGVDGSAYTVVTLCYAGMLRGKQVPIVFYAHRYEGPEADPEYIKRDLARLMAENSVTLAFVDAGFGWGIISDLRTLVPDGLRRIIPMRYSDGQSAVIIYDKEAHQFSANRTRWMAKMFTLIKRQEVCFPPAAAYRYPFLQDFLNIHEEQTPKLKQTRYGHVDTDDSFHSFLYAITAYMFAYNMLEEFANA